MHVLHIAEFGAIVLLIVRLCNIVPERNMMVGYGGTATPEEVARIEEAEREVVRALKDAKRASEHVREEAENPADANKRQMERMLKHPGVIAARKAHNALGDPPERVAPRDRSWYHVL